MILKTAEMSSMISLTLLSSACAAAVDPTPFPSWQGAPDSHESETMLLPV